ncbi:50S ribosomal protein L25 [Hordeum vulgare]|nr:50S ribosomal protein L25 [Hordeum vulgare]
MYPAAGTGPQQAGRLPAASRVGKATSHLLQNPDWAVNLEIYDTLNADRWESLVENSFKLFPIMRAEHLLEKLVGSVVQTDESTGNILNLVIVEADEGTMLKVNLPVVFKGEDVCLGLRKGCHADALWTTIWT